MTSYDSFDPFDFFDSFDNFDKSLNYGSTEKISDYIGFALC